MGRRSWEDIVGYAQMSREPGDESKIEGVSKERVQGDGDDEDAETWLGAKTLSETISLLLGSGRYKVADEVEGEKKGNYSFREAKGWMGLGGRGQGRNGVAGKNGVAGSFIH